jgi:hypothetical protein
MPKGDIDMLVHKISLAYDRALAAGESREDARRSAYLEVSAEFAGERIYIPGLPKAQRARQLAKLAQQSTREVVAATGMPERTVRRLLRGK